MAGLDHVAFAGREEVRIRSLTPSQLRHTAVAAPSGPTTTCGFRPSAPARERVTGGDHDPLGARVVACTRSLLPSERDQTTMAVLSDPTATRGSHASPPTVDSMTGDDHGPYAARVLPCTCCLVPPPRPQATTAMPCGPIATRGSHASSPAFERLVGVDHFPFSPRLLACTR